MMPILFALTAILVVCTTLNQPLDAGLVLFLLDFILLF